MKIVRKASDCVEYISFQRAFTRGLSLMKKLGFMGEGWYFWIGGNKIAGPYSSYQGALFSAQLFYDGH